MSFPEERELFLEVANEFDNGQDDDTQVVRAWEFASVRDWTRMTEWELRTTAEAVDRIAALFNGSVQTENAICRALEGVVTDDVGGDLEIDVERVLAEGVVTDIDRGQAVAQWEFGSSEKILARAEPLDGEESFDDTDDVITLVEDIGLTVVPDPPPTASVDLTLAHATPAKTLREALKEAGHEQRFEDDPKTVRIAESGELGDDRDEILSPDAGNVAGQPTVDRLQDNWTHLLVVGAGDGDDRLEKRDELDRADPNSDHENWLKFSDVELTSQSQVDAVWNVLADEINDAPERVDIELTVVDIDRPRLGDRFEVDIPDRGIEAGDGPFRVVEVEHVIDNAEERFETVLSNRKLTREREGDKDAKDIVKLQEAVAAEVQ